MCCSGFRARAPIHENRNARKHALSAFYTLRSAFRRHAPTSQATVMLSQLSGSTRTLSAAPRCRH